MSKACQTEEEDSDNEYDWQRRVFKQARLELNEEVDAEEDPFEMLQSMKPEPVQINATLDVIAYGY